MSDIIIDANLIRNIGQGNRAAAEALTRMLKAGRRVYIAQAAYNEVSAQYRALLKELGVNVAPASSAAKSAAEKSGMITTRGNVYADNILQKPKPGKGIPGPMTEYGGRRDPVSGLKTRPGDAFVGAEAKALNAELWTLDQQFARQARQQGVKLAAESNIPSVAGAEDVSTARKLLKPEVPTATPATAPKPGVGPARVSRLKDAFKSGLKGALSPESIASVIPDAILAIANKVAVRDAIRTIEVKFIKEGFAKGVAAGVIGWSDEQVVSDLKNRVTHSRVRGLGDAAGTLNLGYILHLAEAYENYAVDLGYHFCSSKPPQWRNTLRAKGYILLAKFNYSYPDDPGAPHEYEYVFIDRFAWAIRHTTNAIVEPAITFK